MTNSDKPSTFDLKDQLTHNLQHGKTQYLKERRDYDIAIENMHLVVKCSQNQNSNQKAFFRYGPCNSAHPLRTHCKL